MSPHLDPVPIRLEQFLRWLTPVVFGFALLIGGLGYFFEDIPTRLAGIVVGIVAALLVVAQHLARQKLLQHALYVFAGSFLISILLLSFLHPMLMTSHAIVPLVIALVVLQYDTTPHDQHFVWICGLTTGFVVAIGTYSPMHSVIPPAVLAGLQTVMVTANLMCALFLVRQLRQQLLGSLRVEQSAHSALSAAHQELRDRSRLDALTGLFHRGALEEISAEVISEALQTNTSVGFVMLDIDHFKRFNDTFGHAAGDLVLRAISDTLRTSLRVSDWAFRYGGEEFVLLLPAIDYDDIMQRTEQLRGRISALDLEYRGQALGALTFSAGIAVCPYDGITLSGLLDIADTALYEAKRLGRNRTYILTASPSEIEHSTR
jgi:diguanylate cyclase (GGDEF)-like protein